MTNFRFIHPVLLVTPLLILWIRLRITGWPVTVLSWVPLGVAVLALTDVALIGLIERQFLREPTASRLRAKGHTPEESVVLVGIVLMLAPVCWALFGSFAGLPVTQLAWYALASVVGEAFWGWRYRRIIYAG